MGKRIGEIERKYKRRSGLGPFFLGTFVGILLGIGAIVGVGFLAYYKATPQWINNTFNTNIDLGSEDLNKITLSQLVSKAMYISNNSDKYTLEDFEKDFGYEIPSEIKGINIEKLKTKPLDKIGEGISDVLNDVAMNDLSELYTPYGDVEKLLDDSLTLYVKTGYLNGDKVYADKDCTEEVAFATIENGAVKVKDVTKVPVDGKVQFDLKDVPLLQGLPVYITHLGDNMTIKRLETAFGIVLPSIIKISDEDKEIKKINDLGDIIDDMYLADFLDYEYDETADKVYKTVDGVKTEVTGAVATISKKKVKELNTLEDTIKTMKVYEVLDYTYQNGKYYDNGSEVTGIMGKIAGYTVGTLSNDIQTLSIADILDYTISGNQVLDKDGNPVKGVLKTIANLTVGNMADQLQGKIDNMTIADVLDYTINSDNTVTDADGNPVKGVLKAIADLKIGNMGSGLQNKIDNMTIADVMDYEVRDGKVFNGSTEVTGTMATLIKKETTVSGMVDAVNNLTIAEALDYTLVDGVYKDNSGNTVSGVLALIDLSDKVTNLSKQIDEVFNGNTETGKTAKTLAELETAGVIDLKGKADKHVAGSTKTLGEMTIQEAVDIMVSLAV